MSIYTHEKFLRDNPALCASMDGGHRRRTSQKESRGLGDSMSSDAQILGLGGLPDMQQASQQQMIMQQMQQIQQQHAIMQQMQQQLQQANQMNAQGAANQSQGEGQGQGNMLNMGGGGQMPGEKMMNSTMGNDSSDGGKDMAGFLGMRRTSLGFMPYLPAPNRRGSDLSIFERRGSGLSIGGLSTVSNNSAVGSMPNNSTSLERIQSVNADALTENVVNATFNEFTKNDIMKNCAAKLGLDWRELSACGSGPRGQMLLTQSGTVSKDRHVEYGLQGLPVVHVNGVEIKTHK